MANEEIRNDEMVEYDTFTYELRGITKEWAIIEEFAYEGKNYVVCQEVLGDTLSEEGLYLFESLECSQEEITVKNIETEEEYNRVVDAYCTKE